MRLAIRRGAPFAGGRWAGTVGSGESIAATLPVPGRWGSGALVALVALLGAALLFGASRAFRGGARRAAESEADPDALIEAIARLDASRAAADPSDPAADARYADARSALNARLERAFARRRGHA